MPAILHEQPRSDDADGTARDTILIIDDDERVVAGLSQRLRQHGFAVTSAGTGAQGCVTAHRDHPDLIILDLRLPDTDGFSVCQALSDAADTCGTPVILLSGMARPDIIRRSRTVGCQYFVRKPYDPSTLLTLIRHSIDETRRVHAPAVIRGQLPCRP
jgi:two-component system OmpR family response regulator